jgi:RimJ/RimL family protein N-acetyltransferase
MNTYKVLNNQIVNSGNFSLVPLRFEDRYDIMNWRNEQLYHLRQNQPLIKEDQDKYFNEVIAKIFDESKPNQILFSFLDGNNCVGYGGLVHINWIDKNAEISFIMDTELEKNDFQKYWFTFLTLLEKVAFWDLQLHKIYTYAFDLRPHLYQAIETAGFRQEVILKEHCFFEYKYIDVVIHSKFKRDSIIKDNYGN